MYEKCKFCPRNIIYCLKTKFNDREIIFDILETIYVQKQNLLVETCTGHRLKNCTCWLTVRVQKLLLEIEITN